MIRAVLALLPIAACTRGDRGIADDRLGGLVVEKRAMDVKVDVDRAALDATELAHALELPFAASVAVFGPFALAIDSKTVVTEGDKPVSDMSEHAVLELGDAASGAFHGTYTNSADYGRETIFLGGTLYLRPRYQAWHARAPESNDEPQTLRDQYAAATVATWDLLAPGAELSDRGPLQVAGRAGRKIEVKLSPSPRAPAKETLVQRRWRETRTVEALSGEIVLDADKGVPLAVKLDGVVGFTRDNRHFTMHLTVDGTVTKVGVTEVAAPAAADVVATPERLKEVDDRDFILKGIAPPLRKGAGDTTPAPAKPAVTPKPEEPKKTKKKSDDAEEKPRKKKEDNGDEDRPRRRKKKPDSDGESPKSEAPKAESPKSEAPKSEAPKADAKPEVTP